MNLSARSAAVRGDDYQYAVAWVQVCAALNDPGVRSISIEDAGGGHFDDIAILRTGGGVSSYFQVKSSNSGNVAIDEIWLTTAATARGKSPLQHFYNSWKSLSEGTQPFTLTLLTNRGFDSSHPLLGSARDNYNAQIRIPEVRMAGVSSALGKARDAWAHHLGVDVEGLLAFLDAVRWEQAGPEETWRSAAKPLMKLAGLRDDDEAVEVGVGIVREMVKTGSGPQTLDQLRQQVLTKGLLSSSAQIVLAVYAIDRPEVPEMAHVTIDWVDQFLGADSWSRFRPIDPALWLTRFPEDLQRARASVETYRSRRVLVGGALRLSTFFAVGYEFPDVRRFVLSIDQRGEIWATDTAPQVGVSATVKAVNEIGQGQGLAIAIALSNDIREDVSVYLRDQDIAVGTLLTIGPEGDPGLDSVSSNEWLTAWARSARDCVRRAARDADRVHLFLSGPGSAALFLGHQWNAVPAPTTIYDFDRRAYFPTFQIV